MILPLIISGTLIVLALMIYDFRYYRLPNLLTATFALTGIAHIYFAAPDMMLDHLLAGLIGFTAFVLISLFYQRVRGIDGMGMGDAKFFAGIGFWVGLYYLAPVALTASLSAILAVLSLHLFGKPVNKSTKIPFGFFLGFGFLVVFYVTGFSSIRY